MKVVVQPTRFQIELGGKWFEASEQEARELWAKLNEHFGPKDATPQPQRETRRTFSTASDSTATWGEP